MTDSMHERYAQRQQSEHERESKDRLRRLKRLQDRYFEISQDGRKYFEVVLPEDFASLGCDLCEHPINWPSFAFEGWTYSTEDSAFSVCEDCFRHGDDVLVGERSTQAAIDSTESGFGIDPLAGE